jgi:tRNA 2-thiouridine synthesizing protein B
MLYLIDKPLADIGLRTAARDDDAQLVLIQDGVLLNPNLDVPTYAVDRDVAVRGVDLPARIEPIAYADLVELLFSHEVKSFV